MILNKNPVCTWVNLDILSKLIGIKHIRVTFTHWTYQSATNHPTPVLMVNHQSPPWSAPVPQYKRHRLKKPSVEPTLILWVVLKKKRYCYIYIYSTYIRSTVIFFIRKSVGKILGWYIYIYIIRRIVYIYTPIHHLLDFWRGKFSRVCKNIPYIHRNFMGLQTYDNIKYRSWYILIETW